MGKKRGTFSRLFRWALGVSLFFHFILIGFKYNYFKVAKKPVSDLNQQKNKITIKFNVNESNAEKRKEKKRQIVDTETSDLKETPKDTRFLSENNQTVDRQVVARQVAPFKSAGQGEKNGQNSPSEADKPSRRKKKITLADLSPSTKAHATGPPPKGEKFGKKSHSGQASSHDYIDDVPLGDMTKLNTIEFKYYGFYHRIKQKLEQYWGLEVRKKIRQLFKKGRRPAKTESITGLSIAIDERGHIVDIKVKSASGVRELDEAAVESFNKAGPFPNPPVGMLKNGIARIEWGFVVKT